MKKLSVKSAGIIDGNYQVVLSDDSILDGISFLEVKKDCGSCGKLTIEVNLPPFNKDKEL